MSQQPPGWSSRCSQSIPAHLPNLISQRPLAQTFPPADSASSQLPTHAHSTCCDPHLTCHSLSPPHEGEDTGTKTPAHASLISPLPEVFLGFRQWHRSVGKESACNAGDLGSIPGSGRCPGEGNGNPLQYSCLGNHMDRGVWQDTVHGAARVGHDLVTKPPPPWQLSGSTSLFPFFTFPRQL